LPSKPEINILDLIKADYLVHRFKSGRSYYFIDPYPLTGSLFIPKTNMTFLRGKLEVRGKDEGRYPFGYLEFIDNVFGPEANSIELCSRTVQVDGKRTAFTVDINPAFKPSLVADARTFYKLLPPGYPRFKRMRSDQPYNLKRADDFYGTKDVLPAPIDISRAASKVLEVGSLMFSLLGPRNYQHCPAGVMRVALIYISVVPNNETRALNIYYKYADIDEGDVPLTEEKEEVEPESRGLLEFIT